MGTIYKEAARVVVWLGPESEYSTLAINILAFPGQQIVMTMINGLSQPREQPRLTGVVTEHHCRTIRRRGAQETRSYSDHSSAESGLCKRSN